MIEDVEEFYEVRSSRWRDAFVAVGLLLACLVVIVCIFFHPDFGMRPDE